MCVDKIVRHNVTKKGAARKRSGLCTCSNTCLHARPAGGFKFKWEGATGAGWRALQHQCGATHQNPVLRRKNLIPPPPLGTWRWRFAHLNQCLDFLLSVCFWGERVSYWVQHWTSNLALLFLNQKEITLLNLPVYRKGLHPLLAWEKCQSLFQQNLNSVKRHLWPKAGKPGRSQEDTNFTENS